MNKIVLCALVALFVCSQQEASAWPSRSRSNKSYTTNSNQPVSTYTSSNGGSANNSTAQGVAELMAQRNAVGHFGGNRGYEGCGSGSTQEAAYRNCCYANSGMATVDVGYAQGRNGRWFCCRRYR